MAEKKRKTTERKISVKKKTSKAKTTTRKKAAPQIAPVKELPVADSLQAAESKDDLSRGEKAVKIVIKYPKTAACVLGAILTLALPPYHQLWALFLAFSGLMFLAFGTNRTRKLAGLGYWFGFGYFAAGF